MGRPPRQKALPRWGGIGCPAFHFGLRAEIASAETARATVTGNANRVNAGNEPELRVGGIPFFIHAAQFDYFRIPPDLWLQSLKRYQELGINTIDLRIPWNWHEPSDAAFDFDGHTNPRRDLRTVLKLITERHLKLTVRPGPIIGDHWRNAGYPPWLLAYSDYKMSAAAIARGEAPQEVELATRDGNAAARKWLANENHMSHARRWLTAVARELAPYNAKNAITITEPGDREGETRATKLPVRSCLSRSMMSLQFALAQIRPTFRAIWLSCEER